MRVVVATILLLISQAAAALAPAPDPARNLADFDFVVAKVARN